MKRYNERKTMKISAPAKINLFLEILGKRLDGYHEIVTVMQKVSLFDYIYMEELEGGIECDCSDPALAMNEGNLVMKAIRLMQQESNTQKGVKVFLEKNIPIGAGLGGGSSNAAAVLQGLNSLWRLGYDDETLMSLAGRLGSDVPFFLGGDTAVCKGRGEVVTPYLLKTKYFYIIIYPETAVNTAEVYKNFKIGLTKNLKDVNLFLQFLESEDHVKLGINLYNRLEEVVFTLYPHIKKIKEELARLDFCGVLVSGSGSSVYGLCRKESDTRQIADKLKTFNFGKVFVVTNDFEGITK